MKFIRKAILVIMFLSTFLYVVFSDEVNTRYTEFHLLSWDDHYDHLVLNLTWAETGTVSFYLENKSDILLNWLVSFVDWAIVQYGSTWVRVCKSENEKSIFWQYITTDSNVFSISTNEHVTKVLNLLFPSWYSGIYYWCVVYYPQFTENDGNLNTVPRKAIFLDVNVSPLDSLFNLKVYPSDRSSYSKKWNIGTMLLYSINNTGQILFSWEVQTDSNWEWVVTANIPNWEYFVVYKWLSHLASYLSWFVIDWESEVIFDFTTWNNLFSTKQYSTLIDDWYRYQVAWDLQNINWLHDWKINVNDITVLVSDVCWYNSTIVDQYHHCNLNGDSMVNMADIWVIITNIWKDWPFLQWHEIFWWF